MKNIFKTFFLVLIVCFSLAGCAKLEYFFKVTPEGQIQVGLEINIDRQEIDDAHYASVGTEQESPDSTELMNFVVMQMYYQQLYLNNVFTSVGEENKPNYNIAITCDGQNFQYIDLGVTSNAMLTLSFDSYEDYLKGQTLLNAAQSEGDSSSEEEKEEKTEYVTKDFFTYKRYIKTDTNFRATLMLEGDNSITTVLKNAYPNFDVNKDVKFVQVYATEDVKLRSNATRKYTKNGICYHIWEYSGAQAKAHNAITMYYVYPNSQGWYILTLGLTLLFGGGYALYVFYKTPLRARQVEKLKKINAKHKRK